MEFALKVFLASFMALVGVVYGAKLVALRLRDGRAPVFVGAPGGAHWRRRMVFRAVQAAIPALTFGRLIDPRVDALAGALSFPGQLAVGSVGAALMCAGLAIAVVSHTYMGVLWRSGVPDATAIERGPDALLQRGPFGRSRNPIFLGVALVQAGYAMAWPSVFTALCLVVGVFALRRQVADEETSLRARFGGSYVAYCARTPRWI